MIIQKPLLSIHKWMHSSLDSLSALSFYQIISPSEPPSVLVSEIQQAAANIPQRLASILALASHSSCRGVSLVHHIPVVQRTHCHVQATEYLAAYPKILSWFPPLLGLYILPEVTSDWGLDLTLWFELYHRLHHVYTELLPCDWQLNRCSSAAVSNITWSIFCKVHGTSFLTWRHSHLHLLQKTVMCVRIVQYDSIFAQKNIFRQCQVFWIQGQRLLIQLWRHL